MTVALDLALIPIIGINGAALASTVSYSIATVYLVFSFRRQTGVGAAAILLVQRRDLALLWQAVRCRSTAAPFRERRMTRRVAICQPKIILGGRLRVIVAIVELLNELGIVPDLVTSAVNFRPNEIAVHYDRDVALNWRMVPQRRLRGVHEEFYIWQFNRRLATISADYDLLIHTGNSLMFLPDHPASISYVFFPRKYRMNSPLRSIHLPDSKVKPLTWFGMQRTLQRAVMRRHPLATPHHVISMTHFTAAALRAVYPELGELPVVYPPVALPTGATLPRHSATPWS